MDISSKKTDQHVIVVWPNSLQFLEHIIQEASKHFEILEKKDVDLSNLNERWLRKFYSRSLSHYNNDEINQIIKAKKAKVGSGKAVIIKILSHNPRYSFIETTNGTSYVNTSCLNLKKKIREVVKADLHISDSPIDSKENYFHLEDFISSPKSEQVTIVKRKSILDFFRYVKTKKVGYVCLRGSDLILKNSDLLKKHHKDIDILVAKKDLHTLKTYSHLTKLTSDKKERYSLIFEEANRHYTCKIDIYPTESGILPLQLEKSMLDNSITLNGIRTPSPIDQDHFDLYHYVFQKRHLPYKKWNDSKFNTIEQKSPPEILKKLEGLNIGEIYSNDYYPQWKSFGSISSLNRTPIHRNLQANIDGVSYFSYIFENKDGNIEKEGEKTIIENEFSILNDLKSDLSSTIPQVKSLETFDDMSVITMSKINGRPLQRISNTTWNLSMLKKHILSGFGTLDIFKKHGIQHRDINPSNVFYTDNELLFIDFGWSMQQGVKNNLPTPKNHKVNRRDN